MTKHIYLVRHGKPDFWAARNLKSVATGEELSELWHQYTESGILPDSTPSKDLLRRSHSIPQMYSSDIKRALDSAQRLLAAGRKLHVDPLFREAEIPHGFWLSLKLPLWAWSTLTRMFWLSSYSLNCEPFAEFRRRAAEAADFLIERTGEHGDVMLVAHGWINFAIFYHLKRQGWQADGNFQRGHWGWNRLSAPLVSSRRRLPEGLSTVRQLPESLMLNQSIKESHEQKET